MPNPIFEFDDTVTPEGKVNLESLQETLRKLNEFNFKDINFGAMRPGAGSVIDGDLIVDGTIGANKIIAGSITADKIAANSITANEIASNTITANQIASNTITANQMNVGQLSAISANIGSITSGTITGTLVRTSASGARVILDDSDNSMKITDSGNNVRAQSIANGLRLFNDDGTTAGDLLAFNTAEFGGALGLIAGVRNLRLQTTSGNQVDIATSNYSIQVNETTNSVRINANRLEGWDDGSHDLGSSSTRWRNLFLSGRIELDGSIRNSSTLFFYIDGSIRFQMQDNAIISRQEIRPFSTLSLNLGSSTRRWETVYCVTLNESSSKELKKNIKPEKYGLADILKLNPVEFNWKDKKMGEEKQLGLIAEELKEVIPEAATENGIKPTRLVPVLIKAIQELTNKVEQLENKVNGVV